MKQILIIVLIGCIRLGRVSEVCTGEFQLSSSIPNHLVLMFVSFFFHYYYYNYYGIFQIFFIHFGFSLCGMNCPAQV